MRTILRKFLSLIFVSFLFINCHSQKGKKYPSPPGYDFDKPVAIHLKGELDEISGIVFYPKDTSIFAINDEIGMLYKIYIRNHTQVVRWKFSDGGDYEDLALVDSNFYVLRSNGSIFSFKVVTKDSVVFEDLKSPFKGKNDFETLYYDDYYKKLILLCKDCKEDNKNSVTAWAFDPVEKTYSSTPFYTLDGKEIKKHLQSKENKFKPSAAAIHPITNDLYIISSVNKGLVICDRKGNIKKVIDIDPARFKQPEGLTFSAAGDLFISNEGAEIGPANILIFKNKTSHKK